MPVLIDSNVLIDLFSADPGWGEWSARRLVEQAGRDELLVNVVVLAEVAHGFATAKDMEAALDTASIGFEPIPREAGFRAGSAHRAYRLSGGSRERTLPDFLIGAHAVIRGYAILTRDTTGYRTYFPGVELISPDTHP
jgi:predicted nucleic acid-binding protein